MVYTIWLWHYNFLLCIRPVFALTIDRWLIWYVCCKLRYPQDWPFLLAGLGRLFQLLSLFVTHRKFSILVVAVPITISV